MVCCTRVEGKWCSAIQSSHQMLDREISLQNYTFISSLILSIPCNGIRERQISMEKFDYSYLHDFLFKDTCAKIAFIEVEPFSRTGHIIQRTFVTNLLFQAYAWIRLKLTQYYIYVLKRRQFLFCIQTISFNLRKTLNVKHRAFTLCRIAYK